MKIKNIIIILIFSILSITNITNIFAQEIQETHQEITLETSKTQTGEDENYFDKASAAIKKGGFFFKTKNVLQYSAFLTNLEKEQLFLQYKQNPLLAGSFNFYLGFGLGSFLQKDWITGSSFLITEALIIGGTSYFIFDTFREINNFKAENTGEVFALSLVATFSPLIITTIGLGVLIVDRLIAAGIGVAVSNAYNYKLKNALNIQDTEINLVPIVNYQNNTSGIGVKIRI